MSGGLLNQQINKYGRSDNNILKVKDESEDVRALLNMAVTYSRMNENPYKVDKKTYLSINHKQDIYREVSNKAFSVSRNDLLRLAIILATSRNITAQTMLMNEVSLKIRSIGVKDYRYMAKIISKQNDSIAEEINKFLSEHLRNFKKYHYKYFNDYYGI